MFVYQSHAIDSWQNGFYSYEIPKEVRKYQIKKKNRAKHCKKIGNP